MNHLWSATAARFFTLTLGLCISTSSFADGLEFSAYAGGIGTSTHKSHLVQDPFNNSPLTGHNDSTAFTPGVGLAYSFRPPIPHDSNDFFFFDTISLGLDAYQFKTSRSGLVIVNGDPNFANYDYSMDIHSARLMLDGQINSNPFWYGLVVFAEAGAGIAWNRLDYNDVPVPGIGGLGLSLPNKTQEQFAYDLGGGLKLPVAEHLQISARYLYSNLGNMKTSTHGNFNIDEPIKVKLRGQSVLLGLTYTIN